MVRPLKHPCVPFSCHKNIMSSSFTSVFTVRKNCGLISYWVMTPFTNVGLITRRSPSQCAHCASSCYPKHRHLWDFSERRSHTFANTQSQWKTGLLCLNTLTKSWRRIKLHLQPRAWVGTHLQYRACTRTWEHTKLRVDIEIKQKNKLGSQSGGQWVTCAGRADTVSSCIHTPTVCLSLFLGTSRWV